MHTSMFQKVNSVQQNAHKSQSITYCYNFTEQQFPIDTYSSFIFATIYDCEFAEMET